ncbi:hypothetical protein [Hymenobacter lapidarius]|nr:hypothetical protein [Hymenobacter lapidarius]
MYSNLGTALATNLGPALRVKNGLFLYFLACWFCTVHALVRFRVFAALAGPQPRSVQLGLGVATVCLFLTDHNISLRHNGIGLAANTVVQAYRDWLSGDAARYNLAQRARYALLKATTTANVRLAPLPVRPLTLFYYDISANATLWGNQAYAEFFGKKAVWVQPLVTKP